VKYSLSHTRTAATGTGFRPLACESLVGACWLYHLVLADDVCPGAVVHTDKPDQVQYI